MRVASDLAQFSTSKKQNALNIQGVLVVILAVIGYFSTIGKYTL